MIKFIIGFFFVCVCVFFSFYRVVLIMRLHVNSKLNGNVRSIHRLHKLWDKIHFPNLVSKSRQAQRHKIHTVQCLITNKWEWPDKPVYQMLHNIYLVSQCFIMTTNNMKITTTTTKTIFDELFFWYTHTHKPTTL